MEMDGDFPMADGWRMADDGRNGSGVDVCMTESERVRARDSEGEGEGENVISVRFVMFEGNSYPTLLGRNESAQNSRLGRKVQTPAGYPAAPPAPLAVEAASV